MKILVVRAREGEIDVDFLHRLRNVGEAVYGKFYFEGIAEVPDMDTAVTKLHIKIYATRHLGEVTTFLKKSLKRHGLAELVEIARQDSN